FRRVQYLRSLSRVGSRRTRRDHPDQYGQSLPTVDTNTQRPHPALTSDGGRGEAPRRPLLMESSVAPLMRPIHLMWLNSVAGSPIFSNRVRIRLLRLGGVEAGSCGIWPHLRFVGGHDVRIGDGVFFNSGVTLDARAHIELGRNVAIGPGALLITSSHRIGPPNHRAGAGEPVFAPIRVGEGCWIGAGAVILGGVTIGRGCIIGAGAVVNHDCEPNGLYTGVPARRKQDLPEGLF